MGGLRVCIDARLGGDGRAGGIETVVVGLAQGFSKLDDGAEEYLFLVTRGAGEWLRPHLSGPCRILEGPASPWPAVHWLDVRIEREGFRGAGGAAWEKVRTLPERIRVPLALSEGTIEKAGVELVHFAFQDAFLTGIPSIYQPHDLQHLHLPEYFEAPAILYREITYRAFCAQAAMVAVGSRWTRDDLMRHYALPSEKVWVVPTAPLPGCDVDPPAGELARAREKFGLPDGFLLYPAQTWPHKNHLKLLEALRVLGERERLKPALVCTGHKNGFYPRIAQRVQELGLERQVRFLGVVSARELACLYRLCRAVVIPTRFEAVSFPLWEAFAAGAPAACSRVTSLPEQAGDAALLFDPDDEQEMAQAIARLWKDEELRRGLAERGRERVAAYSWEKTARLFRAHYRRLAGRKLEGEDERLLSSPAPV